MPYPRAEVLWQISHRRETDKMTNARQMPGWGGWARLESSEPQKLRQTFSRKSLLQSKYSIQFASFIQRQNGVQWITWKYIFILQVVNKNENIINAGNWVLSD